MKKPKLAKLSVESDGAVVLLFHPAAPETPVHLEPFMAFQLGAALLKVAVSAELERAFEPETGERATETDLQG